LGPVHAGLDPWSGRAGRVAGLGPARAGSDQWSGRAGRVAEPDPACSDPCPDPSGPACFDRADLARADRWSARAGLAPVRAATGLELGLGAPARPAPVRRALVPVRCALGPVRYALGPVRRGLATASAPAPRRRRSCRRRIDRRRACSGPTLWQLLP